MRATVFYVVNGEFLETSIDNVELEDVVTEVHGENGLVLFSIKDKFAATFNRHDFKGCIVE